MIEIQQHIHGWTVSIEDLECEFEYYYLHSDGVWRRLTLHNGVYTGYHTTKEEAVTCLEKHPVPNII